MLIFFTIIKPMVIFGLDDRGGVSGSVAAGWQEEKRDYKV